MKNKILLRTLLLSWFFIFISILIFAFTVISHEKRSLLANLQSNAELVANATTQTLDRSIIRDDFTSIIETSLKTVQEKKNILYITVSYSDKLLLTHTKAGWRMLPPLPDDQQKILLTGGITHTSTELIDSDVFHQSFPFYHPNIPTEQWGWIHVGLSLEGYHQNLSSLYWRTFFMSLPALIIAFILSFYLAKKITTPINALIAGTKRIALLDFSSPVLIDSDDEFKLLATAFNSMSQQLQDSQEQLIHSERMAAIGILAGGIAHEFNNLHNATINFIRIVLDDDSTLHSDTRERLSLALDSLERASGVTKNLLAFARKTAIEKKPVYLSTMINKPLKFIDNEYTTLGITVEKDLDDGIVVNVDEKQIGQVILNLLVNAKHALIDSPIQRITIRSYSEGSTAYIEVSDTGCGISKDHQDNIFLPFFSTKGEHATDELSQSRVQGTGLGLSLCQTIIQQHTGKISVASTIGKGATFTIALPLSHENVATTTSQKKKHTFWPGGSLLVLEDEILSQRFLDHLLKTKGGYDVTISDDGYHVLDMIQEKKYDLILMDLQMPKMNGYVFLERLQDIAPEQRPHVIVMSGNAISPSSFDISFDIFDVLPKPFTPDDLFDKVYRALQHNNNKDHAHDHEEEAILSHR
jgi:signal transduction histidine kinase/CheY-like chemotaxis protein